MDEDDGGVAMISKNSGSIIAALFLGSSVKYRRNKSIEKLGSPISTEVQCVTMHSKSKSNKTGKTKT